MAQRPKPKRPRHALGPVAIPTPSRLFQASKHPCSVWDKNALVILWRTYTILNRGVKRFNPLSQ
jgi:hypothetical protein